MATIPIRTVGQNLKGAITTPGTFSLTGFNLQAGVTYAVLAAGATEGGGTLPNPDEAVFETNAAGQPVTTATSPIYDNDSFLSVDPLIQFTPKVSGEYVVAVGGLGGTGTFTLTVTPAGPPIAFDIEPSDPNSPPPLPLPQAPPTPPTTLPGAVNLTDIVTALQNTSGMTFLNTTNPPPDTTSTPMTPDMPMPTMATMMAVGASPPNPMTAAVGMVTEPVTPPTMMIG